MSVGKWPKSARALILLAGVLGSGAAAEPPVASDAKPAKGPASVVLASADSVVRPALDPQRPDVQPIKPRRAMRITSCRCGDPQPQQEPQR